MAPSIIRRRLTSRLRTSACTSSPTIAAIGFYYLNPSSPSVPTLFRSGLSQPVDIAVGPDGALYYLQRGDGRVGRVRYTGRTSQGIVVSANQLEIGEGSRAVLSVRLAKRPPEDKAVMFERLMSDPSITGFPTSMTFTPSNWNMARLFTVSAAHDGDNIDETATFVLSSSGVPSVRVWVKAVDDDRPAGSPQANITLPRNADTVSGRRAEFFGDGRGNVVRAEFLVDGTLRYTDVNRFGHYHFGGDHNMWNTETLSNGQHVVTMRVVDEEGRSGSHSLRVNVSN